MFSPRFLGRNLLITGLLVAGTLVWGRHLNPPLSTEKMRSDVVLVAKHTHSCT